MIRPACFAKTIDGWRRPTPLEIALYLDQKNLSNYAVEKLIGVHRSTVGRWLSGEIEIKFSDWSALIRAVSR